MDMKPSENSKKEFSFDPRGSANGSQKGDVELRQSIQSI